MRLRQGGTSKIHFIHCSAMIELGIDPAIANAQSLSLKRHNAKLIAHDYCIALLFLPPQRCLCDVVLNVKYDEGIDEGVAATVLTI